MKKLIFAVTVGLFLYSCNDGTPDMATFDMPGNTQVTYGQQLKVKFEIPEGVSKVELVYNNTTIQSWSGKTGKQSYAFNVSKEGVGAREIVLRSTFADGTSLESSFLVRVVSDIAPKLFKAEIAATMPHNKENYTQGLEFDGTTLYEATGDPGQQGKTLIGKVEMTTGNMSQKIGLDASYFGEGITIFGNQLYQLTWQNGKCFVYDKNNLEMKLKDFTYTGEGWGLCNDGKYLIMSDGTERIYFRDPNTFEVVKTIEVYDNVGPRLNLNELEFANGKVYANIYQTDVIIAFDPATGRVLEEIDGSTLVEKGKNGGDVLNGIAYNKTNSKFYMTGKYWDKLFEVNLTPFK